VRLLYVTSSFPHGHGEGFLVAELRELEAQGHEVTIVPAFARGAVVHDDARALACRSRTTPLLSTAVARSSLHLARSEAAATRRNLAALSRSRSLLVFAKNAVVFPKSLWTAQLARDLAVDHIHAHWAGTSGTIAMIAADLSGIPWSLTVHRWDIREDNLLRRKAASAAFVRAISSDGLTDLRHRIGDTTATTVLIHMGVPIPPKPVDLRARGAEDPLRILVPANLLEVKGHRHLIEAVARLRTQGVAVSVELAGQGPLRRQIEEQIARYRLEGSVVLLGQLSHTSLLGGLGAGVWDAVVMPSVETPAGEKEGIPVALLEAMSYGIPVVGTSAGGVAELLEDGSGLLVPPADAPALAQALAALAFDGTLRTRLGVAGRARVERDFASQTVVRELAARFAASVKKRR